MLYLKQNISQSNNYKVSRQEKNIVGQRAVYNEISCHIYVDLLEQKDTGEKILQVEIRDYQQEYQESLYGWANDLIKLKEKLILETDSLGQIVKIKNINDVKRRWAYLKEELAKKYQGQRHYKNIIRNINTLFKKEDAYAKTLRYSFPYDMLFQNIYDKDYSEPQESYFEIPSFFIANLPIKTVQQIDSQSIDKKQWVISEKGELDISKFDQPRFDNAIKNLRQEVRARTQVEVKYLKKAEIDVEDGWVNQGFSFVSATVPGFIYREEITEITQIN